MPAVAALPYLDLALGENLRHLHIVQQGTVALLMVLLNGGDQAETLGQLMETFLIGSFGNQASLPISALQMTRTSWKWRSSKTYSAKT